LATAFLPATVFPTSDMPGLTGDIASARWVAKIAIIKSAAVTPATGDKRSELTELFVMDVTLLNSDATHNAPHRRFQRVSFRSLDVFVGWYS
jgi:hypothetical protein